MEVVAIYLISQSTTIRKSSLSDAPFVDIPTSVAFEREREMTFCEYRNSDIDCSGIGLWGILPSTQGTL